MLSGSQTQLSVLANNAMFMEKAYGVNFYRFCCYSGRASAAILICFLFSCLSCRLRARTSNWALWSGTGSIYESISLYSPSIFFSGNTLGTSRCFRRKQGACKLSEFLLISVWNVLKRNNRINFAVFSFYICGNTLGTSHCFEKQKKNNKLMVSIQNWYLFHCDSIKG